MGHFQVPPPRARAPAGKANASSFLSGKALTPHARTSLPPAVSLTPVVGVVHRLGEGTLGLATSLTSSMASRSEFEPIAATKPLSPEMRLDITVLPGAKSARRPASSSTPRCSCSRLGCQLDRCLVHGWSRSMGRLVFVASTRALLGDRGAVLPVSSQPCTAPDPSANSSAQEDLPVSCSKCGKKRPALQVGSFSPARGGCAGGRP